MLSDLQNITARLERTLAPLWPIGVALALVLACHYLLPLRGEALEWASYGAFGVVLPVLTLGIALLIRRGVAGRLLRLSLALYGLVAGLMLIPSLGDAVIWVLALGQVVAPMLLAGSERWKRIWRNELLACALTVLVALIAWWVAGRLVYLETYNRAFLNDGWRLASCALAAALVFGALWVPPAGRRSASRLLVLAYDGVAVVIFLLMSLRLQPVVGGGADMQLHWAAVLGSAEMVRHGAWLLWDMPSQYGFLNILLLQALPFDSLWLCFYLFNAAMYFVAACALYALLRAMSPSPWNLILALTLTVAVLFLMPGLGGSGVYRWPGHSPYRFVWCYVLLLMVLLACRSEGKRARSLLFGGCGVWLVGALWSFEGFIYCSAIWLPTYVLLTLRHSGAFGRPQASLAAVVRRVIPWLLLPVLLVGASAAAIALFYVARLGHAPDIRTFSEYVLSFGGGFGSVPIAPDGGVWVLVLTLVALAVFAAPLLWRRRVDIATIAPLLSAFGAVWATSSYFIGRSPEVTIRSLLPLCVAAAALALATAGRSVPRLSRRFATTLLVPLLALPLAFCYSNVTLLRQLRHEAPTAPASAALLAPRASTALAHMLAPMRQRGEAVQIMAYVNTDSLQTDGAEILPHWLPIDPIVLFHPLPADRARVYLARYAERTHASGWLVEPANWDRTFDTPTGRYNIQWLYDYLNQAYRPTKVIESNGWRATWFEYIVTSDE